ncbi:hypothetical protein HanRHA438_Chr15g0727841 [Helianthus annuus]|uniref:Uncharacterized protein n=1 Tax=Helianthus annuus TaxID=4232 RepID=A0A251SBN6_HELAN|nr:hypothetical protein HanXRQr2_Chr15g0715571 [Helianthus annuus]KAJ0833118.1 hypothetical protein HanPSC8_Chr15g0686631 [Helianthus annuus]KAJ0846694.1 hypothetical protein HanRHA438_Chr15g0727841 [Helianthus annuus]
MLAFNWELNILTSIAQMFPFVHIRRLVVNMQRSLIDLVDLVRPINVVTKFYFRMCLIIDKKSWFRSEVEMLSKVFSYYLTR